MRKWRAQASGYCCGQRCTRLSERPTLAATSAQLAPPARSVAAKAIRESRCERGSFMAEPEEVNDQTQESTSRKAGQAAIAPSRRSRRRTCYPKLRSRLGLSSTMKGNSRCAIVPYECLLKVRGGFRSGPADVNLSASDSKCACDPKSGAPTPTAYLLRE